MGPNAATGPHLLPFIVLYDTVLHDMKCGISYHVRRLLNKRNVFQPMGSAFDIYYQTVASECKLSSNFPTNGVMV